MEAAAATSIDRSKTAIVRNGASRPLRLAIEGGVLSQNQSFFDYGCGRGEDVEILQKEGFQAAGWDPAHAPRGTITPADVVQLSYVLNVIESPAERHATLLKAWQLASHALVVSVQVDIAKPSSPGEPHGDGYVTSRGTFQKYFSQDEARGLLKTVTEAEPLSAAPGIFFLFRTESARLSCLARRRRRGSGGVLVRLPRPTRERSAVKDRKRQRYAQQLAAAAPLMELLLQLGRWPVEDELNGARGALEHFRSPSMALRFAEENLDTEDWRRAQSSRRDDLMVFLALARFGGRPKYSELPVELQRDVRAFFKTHGKACEAADEQLFATGDLTRLREAARQSGVGKLLPDALYVHRSAVERLPAILRVYEGCASEFLGEVDWTLAKLSLKHPAVSYVHYPTFEKEPHPALAASLRFDLANRRVQYRDYSGSANVPILHRKETLVAPDHPLYERFSRLTKQEERHGLLEDATAIGYSNQWQKRLDEMGWALRGHRLVRAKSPALRLPSRLAATLGERRCIGED